MDGKTVFGIVVAVLVVIGVIFKTSGREGNDGEDVLQSAREMVSICPLYEANKDYFEYLLTQAHDHAFDKAYTIMPGRRRTHVDFDSAKYMKILFEDMITLANEGGSKHIADQLALLRQVGPAAFANQNTGQK